jgi:hypothetical protein
MWEMRNAYAVLILKTKRKRSGKVRARLNWLLIETVGGSL